ncbi:MAG: Glu-tRNA(Gln) amidotransferase subunit GatE [Candidatus Thermoplasmatota archaeon]|nr:Glu-tRNA(Gln) amidotransferase subunit GatE [Candidatus Thermoplasmatota archaeon]
MADVTHQEPQGDVTDASTFDTEQLGFMCGIEVHQQLATGKLHSRQPSELFDVTIDSVPEDWPRYARRLRLASGEGGKVDVAARFEKRRNRSFVYIQSPNSGLIELDESPPLSHDSDALDVALTVSAMLGAKPVGAVQTMRKTVVDGSNTSGFQRTSLISTDGTLKTDTGDVGIDVLCLEEDSARKLDTIPTDHGEQVIYNLDRLGVPLIEIATSPDIQSPEHAKETAMALGRTLRDTRRVRRGLGSIRQDLNVSVGCGDRVEIKGCQDLGWIPQIVRLEMVRQVHMYRLANDLRSSLGLPPLPPNRDLDDIGIESEVAEAVAEHIPLEYIDVTNAFASCESRMVTEGLARGYTMLSLPLNGFAGKIGSKSLDVEGAQLPRLGRELAGAAKLAGVRGVFHSDELPAYGIEEEHIEAVRNQLKLRSDDAFVLCLAPSWQARLALESVGRRARLAFHRIPQEVRNVVVKKGAPDDGTTTPMRPLPGGARMYPETDVPTIPIHDNHWRSIVENLPMRQEERMERLAQTELSEDQCKQLLSRELDDVFFDHHESKTKAWGTLLLEHESVQPVVLSTILTVREAGGITREGIEQVVDHFAQAHHVTTQEIEAYADENGLVPADIGDLESIIEGIVLERIDFVQERGMGAMGPLMGVVMGACPGVDGKEVSAVLRTMIQRHS